MNLLYAAIFLLLALAGVVIRKTYCYVPVRELKRRAAADDAVAKKIYPVAAYGSSLRALLWLYIGLFTAASLIILARELNILISLFVVGPVLWAAFSWLPNSRVTKIGTKLTLFVTPAILGLLNYLHPILGRSSEAVRRRTSINEHTGMYEKEDLVRLIEQLQWQKNSRFTPEELEIAHRALTFDSRKVGDIISKTKKLKSVLANDIVGPLLIDDLHKSQVDYALVRAKKGGEPVGTLAFRDLGIASEGKVADLMDDKVYYVHQNDSLADVLHAFFVTNQPVFVVVNSFEELLGIVSVENILHQLLGHVPGHDFDQFADLQAVAKRHHHPKTDQHEPETGKSDDKVLE